MGNTLQTARTYNAVTGRLEAIATTGTASPVQQNGFSYDTIGNLLSRSDSTQGITETFGYDALNRLTSATGAGVAKTYAYNAIGNLTSKTGTGTYIYPLAGAARPHAVSSITGTINGVVNPTFTYDANGNMLTGAGRSLTWTSFDMPASITRGTATDTFLYDAYHERFKKTGPDGTTIYLSPRLDTGTHYEKVTSGTLVSHKHYIYAGNRPIAIYTQRSTGVNDTRYLHADNLGSITDRHQRNRRRRRAVILRSVRQTPQREWQRRDHGTDQHPVTSRLHRARASGRSRPHPHERPRL